jgi:hypothetical protein
MANKTMKRITAILFIGNLIFCIPLLAQENKEAPSAAQEAMMALAKASQNPVADMNTIPIQFNWYTGGGLGDQSFSQTLIQPVLPLPLNKNWNIVSRTIVPIMNIPNAYGERLKGIADIQEQIFLSPSQSKKIIWGLGPVFSLPTATINDIATGQFAAGPAAVVLAMPGKFVIGAVANNIWRIAGSDNTKEISSFFIQPFINYNLKGGWAITTAPSITANWSAESDQQWTVPVGLGVSKITLIGQQPFNISIQYYHNAVRPDNAGADQVRMVVALLFPRKK